MVTSVLDVLLVELSLPNACLLASRVGDLLLLTLFALASSPSVCLAGGVISVRTFCGCLLIVLGAGLRVSSAG